MSFTRESKRNLLAITFGITSLVGVAAAQDTPTRWRKVTDPPPPEQARTAGDQAPANEQAGSNQNAPNPGSPNGPAYPSSFPSGPQPGYPGGPSGYPGAQMPQQNQYPYPPPGNNSGYQGGYAQRPAVAIPSQLNVKPGTFVSVRVNNPLSSDRNQQGDAFTATLVKPIIVDGVVVARTGETIAGRISEAQKAGRVSGTSRLGLQLTELTMVDGSQVPLQSDLVAWNGNTSNGSDAAVVGTTTAAGVAIGAAADGGRGAAIGAGAGAAAGLIGVLLTRGQPTVVYPETVLTFRVTIPVTISTDRAPQAFRFAEESDYHQGVSFQPRPAPPVRVAYGPVYPPYYGAPYPYYYGPSYLWGPTFGVYVGPRYRYYGRRW